MNRYTVPSFHGSAFHCPQPSCGAYAKQNWYNSFASQRSGHYQPINNLQFAFCEHCDGYSIWKYGQMIFPDLGNAPMPNVDLPEDLISDYEEANSILNKSPRGAAAILRLTIEKLCEHLGAEGKDINSKIAHLVKKGLPEKIQKSLDIVRVIGNYAVHPGQIDLKDDIETATHLFGLVNIIAEVMITQPKHVNDLFETLPENQKYSISKRDSQDSQTS